jgi:hypothetical protein
MKHSDKRNRPLNKADIERAAWFARLAFGAPSACIERVPAKPPQKSMFDTLP